MNVTVGNPVRLIALIAVCAVAGGALFIMRGVGGGNTETAAPPTTNTPRTQTTPKGSVPAPKPAATDDGIAANGLPSKVAAALRKHRVVVVSVIAPNAQVDDLAVREARAGAKDVGAGFVVVNAYRQREIAPFEAKVVFRASPAVVVMRRPDQVIATVPGFADRASVAQAATNARRS